MDYVAFPPLYDDFSAFSAGLPLQMTIRTPQQSAEIRVWTSCIYCFTEQIQFSEPSAVTQRTFLPIALVLRLVLIGFVWGHAVHLCLYFWESISNWECWVLGSCCTFLLKLVVDLIPSRVWFAYIRSNLIWFYFSLRPAIYSLPEGIDSFIGLFI